MSRWKGKKSPWLELIEKERRRKDGLNKYKYIAQAKLKREAEIERKSNPPKTTFVPVRKPTENALIDAKAEEEYKESDEYKEKNEDPDEFTWNLVGGLSRDPDEIFIPKKIVKKRRMHLKLGSVVKQSE